MRGRIEHSGSVRFDAENGCIALGVLKVQVRGDTWNGLVNVTNCQVAELNGRYEISLSGGRPRLTLRFNASRSASAGVVATYEVAGTFQRYRPV
jgi:hypothetical protein